MVLKLCVKCGKPTGNPRRLCDGCAKRLPVMQWERNAIYDKHRDPVVVAFYHSAAWKRLRRKKLIDCVGLCEECVREWREGRRAGETIQLAMDVHHVEPVAVN